jgi:hypothetical protein
MLPLRRQILRPDTACVLSASTFCQYCGVRQPQIFQLFGRDDYSLDPVHSPLGDHPGVRACEAFTASMHTRTRPAPCTPPLYQVFVLRKSFVIMDGLPPPPLTQITQYPPANETAADLWNEESGLDGIMLSAVAYGAVFNHLNVNCAHYAYDAGVHATLFFLCSKFLWLDRKRRPHASALWMLYIAAHFVCGTIAVGADMKWAVMIWIKDRGYPGGPIAFTADYENFWIPFMGNVTSVISAWLQDWLLVRYISLSLSDRPDAYVCCTVVPVLCDFW